MWGGKALRKMAEWSVRIAERRTFVNRDAQRPHTTPEEAMHRYVLLLHFDPDRVGMPRGTI